MPLTLPNLDDRSYADLVEEARSLIPVYAPAWTNHNESDPGITLIELFAYLTEMLIYRLNRITDAETLAFLKLINGPDWSSSGDLRQDKRVSVQALRQPYRAVTCNDYVQLTENYEQGDLLANHPVARANCVSRRNLSPGGQVTRFVFPDPVPSAADAAITLNITKDKKLYLGASESFNNVQFKFTSPGSRYQLFFEYYDSSGKWLPLSAPTQVIDSTNNWIADGFVEFSPPGTWQPVTVNAQTKFWLRIGTNTSPIDVAKALIAFNETDHLSLCIVPADISFDNVLVNVRVGDANTYVDHTAKTRAERQIPFGLDFSQGSPGYLHIGSLTGFQNIYFELATGGAGYNLQFEYSSGPNQWTKFAEQDHLVDGTANLTTSGSVQFLSPLAWAQAEVGVGGDTRYWVRVTSSSPAQKAAQVYHIARAQIRISDLIENVLGYLDGRRLLATRLHVMEPNYVDVKVQATLFIKPDAFDGTVRSAAVKALRVFFDPLYGGRDKQGWPFGRNVYASEVYELLDQLTGVDYVDSIKFSRQVNQQSTTDQDTITVVEILSYQLVAVSVTEDDITIVRSTPGSPV